MKKLINKKTVSGFATLIAFVIFTVLVLTVDVEPIGHGATSIGFATVNAHVLSLFGASETWLTVTDILGLIPLMTAFAFALVGAYQLIKGRSLGAVDKEIIALGILYFAVIVFYVFFELVIINYAPILKDGEVAASYPSSHTLLTVTVMISGAHMLCRYNLKPIIKHLIHFTAYFVIGFTVVGRLLAGVHWVTDIFASLILSASLLLLFFGGLDAICNKEKI